jgi:high-affinity Fe2+/Pb2+ permease
VNHRAMQGFFLSTTLVLLMILSLMALWGVFELARASWLLSQTQAAGPR